MFTAWISPSEEEIRERYNPDLKRRSLANREAKQAEFDHFVTKLKEYSKSDKPSMSIMGFPGYIYSELTNYNSLGCC